MPGVTISDRPPTVLVDGVLAGGLAIALLPATAISLASIARPAGTVWADLTAFALLHACVILRRTAPGPGFVVGGLAMLWVVLAPNELIGGGPYAGPVELPILFLPSSLSFLVLVDAVGCAWAGRRLGALALSGSVAGAVLSVVRIGSTVPPAYPRLQYRIYLALALVTAVSAAWALGRSRRRAQLRADAERAAATRDTIAQERARIARDLHDIVAHSLAVVVRQAEGGTAVAARRPDQAVQALRTIAVVGRDALADMRNVLRVLRDPEAELDDEALDAGLAQLPEVVEAVRAAGLGVAVRERGDRYDVGRSCELAAHHVVREALTNSVKHAGPGAEVEVRLEWLPDRFVVEVRDDGGERGRDHGTTGGRRRAVPGSGGGLLGLRERVSAQRGTFSAEPVAGGFAVLASFPRPGPDGLLPDAEVRSR